MYIVENTLLFFERETSHDTLKSSEILRKLFEVLRMRKLAWEYKISLKERIEKTHE